MFEWTVAVMSAGGYPTLGALMTIENVFPPIPSEVVMPLGGFLAAQGRFSLPLVILVGTFGSVLGATFWYWVGARLGEARLRRIVDRHGRWLTISLADVDRASAWFARHGRMAVFVGRFLPGARTLISVPAGIAGMPLLPFLVFTTMGSVIWIGALAVAGYLLESRYDRISGWLDPLTWVVLGACVALYLWRVVTGARRTDQ